MTPEAILERLEEKFGDRIETFYGEEDGYKYVNPTVVLKDPEDIVEVGTFCRDDEELQFDLLVSISGVDYLEDKRSKEPPHLDSVYHLDSTVHHQSLAIKAVLDREDPRLPTVVDVWQAADWHERETFDLLGIVYEGHPNLKRILCAEDWEGHPLRKDYKSPKTYHGIPNRYEDFYIHNHPTEGSVDLGPDADREARKIEREI